MADIRDALASELAESLNTKFGGNQVAYFLAGDESAPTNVSDWIQTGSTMLDLAVSNRPNGGLPLGRIIEINGLESSGKSLLGATILKKAQDRGGLGVYISTENAEYPQFLNAIGVDLNNLLYMHMEMVEDIFESVATIIERVRKSDSNRIVVILVDSMAGASSKSEMEADFEKQGFNTEKAIVNSMSLRKITNTIGRERILLVVTNQLREKPGVMFGDKYVSPGGKALAFHSSVRIRLAPVGKIKKTVSGDQKIIGMKTKAKVLKNRVGPPFREAEFDIYFDRGIDDTVNYLGVLKGMKLLEYGKGTVKINEDHTGKYKKGKTEKDDERPKMSVADFAEKMSGDNEFHDFFYNKICEREIMKYQQKQVDPEEIEVSNDMDGLSE